MRRSPHTSVARDIVRGHVSWSSLIKLHPAHWWLMSAVEMESTSALTPIFTWYDLVFCHLSQAVVGIIVNLTSKMWCYKTTTSLLNLEHCCRTVLKVVLIMLENVVRKYQKLMELSVVKF